MSVNTSDPMIGRLVDGRYQVRSRIARGGMATVYLATDLRLERRVAIKIMHGHLADDSKFRERFIQEARSAARLAHPNVVNVFDQGSDTEMAYLVMEYLPGITLRDLLQERKTLTTEQTFDILEAVLSGLAAAHKAGIVHRDLKPENVLLADDGRIKIGDFGLARAASANTATGAALLGTIAYLSPELVTRGVADTRSDIYAVGIMLYEMLAGEQPFKGEQPMQIAYQHANGSVPSPSGKNPRVPAELDELVLWATARDPEERPRDARTFLEQVTDTRTLLKTALPTNATAAQRTMVLPPVGFAGSNDETQVLGAATAARAATGPQPTGPTPATASLATVTEKRRKRGWWLVAAIILVVAVVGGLGWYFGTGPGARVTIPESIRGLEPAAAIAQLEELEITVVPETRDVFDPEIAAGLVAGTDPELGSSVARDTPVTVLVSTGPEPRTIPALAGQPEADAIAAAEEAGFILDDTQRREVFSADVPAGVVTTAYGNGADGAAIELVEGAEYYDQRPVWFTISVGPLPDVTGLDTDAASTALTDAGLVPSIGGEEYSDAIDKTLVTRFVASSGSETIYKGDSVLIYTSRGPEMVVIPDVEGMTQKEAKAKLTEVGLIGKSTGLLQDVEDATVTRTEPGVGTSVAKGSTITLKLSYFD